MNNTQSSRTLHTAIDRAFTSTWRKRRQSGAALFFAIVFLVVMTLLALAAANTSLMQERMVGGLRSQQIALISADTVLREVEQRLWNLSFVASQPLPPCPLSDLCVWTAKPQGGLKTAVQNFRSNRETAEITGLGLYKTLHALEGLSGDAITARIARRPDFIIEDLGKGEIKENVVSGGVYPEQTSLAGGRRVYRITARSVGGTANVQRVAESVYLAMDLTNTGFNPGDPPP